MKKIYLLLLAVAGMLLTACDDVDLDKRVTFIEPPQANRAVLIQDFTGQRCVNCPKAAEEIHRLQEEFGDTAVIAVAIHSGPFGKSTKGEPTPLYTTTGDEYFNHWGLQSQPIGVIDWLYVLEYSDWSAGVMYELQQDPTVSISVNNTYDEASGNLDVTVDVIGLADNTVSGKLQVWLIEDSIIDYQLMPDGSTNNEYVHNHVFRTCVTSDIWGDAMTLKHGEVKQATYTQAMDAKWVPSRCSIVAFLYDDEGTKQVAKSKVTE